MSYLKMFLLICFSLILSKCAKVHPSGPFIIHNATYNESLKEITFNINFSSEKPVEFLNLFFRNKTIKVNQNSTTNLSGIFNKLKNIDLQLHKDAKKEFGNTSLSKKESFPFELNKNEAVLSYKEKNSVKFFKISTLKKQD